MEYHLLCDLRTVEEIGLVMSLSAVRPPSEKMLPSKQYGLLPFILLLAAWLLTDSGMQTTHGDQVGSGAAMLALDALCQV